MKKLLITIPFVLIAGAAGLYFYGNYRARAEVDTRLQELVRNGSFEALEYESLELHPNGEIDVSNLRAVKDGQEVIVQKIHVSEMDLQHEIPWTVDVTVEGFHFPAGLPDVGDGDSSAGTELIESFVVDDTIPLQARYRYDYQPDNANQFDYNMSLHLDEAFTLDASGVMRNVPLEALIGNGQLSPEEAQAQMMQQMAAADVPEALWTLKDEGIVDRLIQAAAQEGGITADAVREDLTSQVRNMYLFLPQNAQGFGMNAGLQIAAFLEGGRTLSVKVAPEYEGNVQRLQQEIMAAAFVGDIPKIVELLHLEITAQ